MYSQFLMVIQVLTCLLYTSRCVYETEIIPGDKEQAMFDECIEHIRLIKLKEEDRDIRLKLSLADNETDQQKVRQLMERHMEIQRILKKDK